MPGREWHPLKGQTLTVDGPAIAAGWDIVKQLGPDAARGLLKVLELSNDQRWAFISSMYLRDVGEWLAEVLTDVEQDLTGEGAGAADVRDTELPTGGPGQRSARPWSAGSPGRSWRSGPRTCVPSPPSLRARAREITIS